MPSPRRFVLCVVWEKKPRKTKNACVMLRLRKTELYSGIFVFLSWMLACGYGKLTLTLFAICSVSGALRKTENYSANLTKKKKNTLEKKK